MKHIITVVMPEGYDGNNYEKFGKEYGLEVWHSHTLAYPNNIVRQIRSALMENKPIQAYELSKVLENELKSIMSEHAKPVPRPHEG